MFSHFPSNSSLERVKIEFIANWNDQHFDFPRFNATKLSYLKTMQISSVRSFPVIRDELTVLVTDYPSLTVLEIAAHITFFNSSYFFGFLDKIEESDRIERLSIEAVFVPSLGLPEIFQRLYELRKRFSGIEVRSINGMRFENYAESLDPHRNWLECEANLNLQSGEHPSESMALERNVTQPVHRMSTQNETEPIEFKTGITCGIWERIHSKCRKLKGRFK
jgi:hypothetical protein